MKMLMYKLCLVVGLISFSQIIYAQSGKALLAVEGNIIGGGDGFGMYINPSVTVGYSKVAINLGPLIQYNECNVSGIQFKPMVALSDSGYRRVYIYVFSQSLYNREVYLSETYQEIMDRQEPEKYSQNPISFKTYQQYVGIGLSGGNWRRVVLKSEIGVGGYLNLKNGESHKVSSKFQSTRSNSDISLMFSIGVRVNIIKQVK